MTLRPLELAQVMQEIATTLERAPVQKVVQPDQRTLLLGFPHRWLLLSIHPRRGRIHLLDDKPAGTGQAAPAFCMLARKLLLGSRLEAARAVTGERAAELVFLRADQRHRLLLFLYGASAQLALLDGNHAVAGRLGGGLARSSLPPPLPLDEGALSRFAVPSISAAVAAHYHAEEARAEIEERRAHARAEIERRRKRLLRLATHLTEDLAATERTDELRRDADLLLAHLREIPRGVREVTLPDDFTDGTPRRIVLDPARTAREQATRLYREQQRLTRGRRRIEARLSETHAALTSLDDELARIEQSPTPPEKRPPVRRTNRRRPAERLPFWIFVAHSGEEIWVGRSARDNQQLTFRYAHGDDLWLHVRDFAGSHVVVPRRGRPHPPDEATLLDAATLAAHHSRARHQPQIDVTYALCKHVRQLGHGSPGEVSIARGRTLHLRQERTRLERLLATRRDDHPA